MTVPPSTGSCRILLFEAQGSPYAQKIKITSREKSAPFDVQLPESLGTGRTDGPFGLDNPRTQVPVLVDGQTRILVVLTPRSPHCFIDQS